VRDRRWNSSSVEESDTDRLGDRFQLSVDGRQRQAAADCQLEICGIVSGEIVAACQFERIAPGGSETGPQLVMTAASSAQYRWKDAKGSKNEPRPSFVSVYLTEWQQHSAVHAAYPERWMPWNYRYALS
jgi:hypothetical protein